MTRARFPDPYEGMSDEELDRRFAELITSSRQPQRVISIRFPDELLNELRRLADQLGVGYQTLIKRLLAQDVARLRARRTAASHRASRTTTTVGSPKSTAQSPTAKRTTSPAVSSRGTKRATRRPRVPL